MKKVRAIIVDDEEMNRESLSRMLNQFIPEIQLIKTASSINEARELIKSDMPDIVFLDVEMPEESGFELFKYYPNPTFSVIFTTAHAGYALKAIKFAALDYLLKPINLNELKGAINKVLVTLDKNSIYEKHISSQIQVLKNNTEKSFYTFNKIAIPTQDGMDFYEVNDIIRCEAEGSYTIFHLTGSRKIVASKVLRDFEDMLEECNFLRVHRSDIVNLSHIKKYFKGQGGYLIMSDGARVEVSARKKDELMQALQKGKKLEV